MNFGNFNFGNMEMLMKVRQAYSTFLANHPKIPVFMNQVKEKGFTERTEIAVAIRYPDGTEIKTGIRVRESDLELLNMVKNMK